MRRYNRPPWDKGNGKKDKAPTMYSCFLGNRPHRVFNCPKSGKLAAVIMEEERQEEEGKIAFMLLLSAIQMKVEEQPGDHMYV